MSIYNDVWKTIIDNKLSPREAITNIIEVESGINSDTEINKHRYMRCYNKFNNTFSTDVYELTKSHNAKIDEWIRSENGYNKKFKNSKNCALEII